MSDYDEMSWSGNALDAGKFALFSCFHIGVLRSAIDAAFLEVVTSETQSNLLVGRVYRTASSCLYICHQLFVAYIHEQVLVTCSSVVLLANLWKQKIKPQTRQYIKYLPIVAIEKKVVRRFRLNIVLSNVCRILTF